MKIEKKIFGKLKEKDITSYKLINDKGMIATFLDLGGTNFDILVRDKDGKYRDIVMQYKNLLDIEEGNCFFGAIVARSANRIANAIAKISGVDYKLQNNDNGNNLHSGLDYFHNKILKATIKETPNEVSVEFLYQFKDMEQGYPGNMDIKICYTLTNDNELKIRYEAVSDKDTIFNPTWHSYFNLAGFDYNDISTHKIKINADKFSYINKTLIPIKECDVKGTPLDFTFFRYMNDRIDDVYEQIKFAGGFDHNFILKEYDGTIKKVAEVIEDNSGIKMEVFTDMPCMQFYAGNMINATHIGKDDKKFVSRGAFCLETQYAPNSINDGVSVSSLIKKGERKTLNTIYKFSLAEKM